MNVKLPETDSTFKSPKLVGNDPASVRAGPVTVYAPERLYVAGVVLTPAMTSG